jgi:3-oxoacyl-[acyl-carrier protein] reductase
MKKMDKLLNKTALITGSNRGIGFSIMETFARQGCNVLAHARKKNDAFEKKIDDFSSKHNVFIKPIYFDLQDSTKIRSEIMNLIKTKVPIDILVNCAGIIHGGLFQMTHIKTIRDVFDVNFFGMLEITQLVCKSMIRNKKGSIINIASVAGIDLSAGNCAYGTSKAAVIAFTKTLSSEMGKHGIRVNVVAPSLTDTDMGHTPEARMEREMLSSSTDPFKRMALPDEIGNVVRAILLNGSVLEDNISLSILASGVCPISVSVKLGATTFTLIPCFPISDESVFVKAITAALEVP